MQAISHEDLVALAHKFDELSAHVASSRGQILELCKTADLIGSVEALPLDELTKQVQLELSAHKNTFECLVKAALALETATGMVRSLQHSQAQAAIARETKFANECFELESKTMEKQVEYAELVSLCLELDAAITRCVVACT